MEIRAGYDITFQCFQDTPMVLMLSIDPIRKGDLLSEHRIQFSPNVPSRDYFDVFGNTCTRIVAPAGLIEMRNEFVIADSGLPDEVAPHARQLEVGELPDDVLVYLLGSRYCDTQKLSNLAWSLFGAVPPGWQRVQAICDAVHLIDPAVLVLCHGGPIAEPDDVAFILSRTHGVAGFFGASSVERLPTEIAITENMRRLKALLIGGSR